MQGERKIRRLSDDGLISLPGKPHYWYHTERARGLLDDVLLLDELVDVRKDRLLLQPRRHAQILENDGLHRRRSRTP